MKVQLLVLAKTPQPGHVKTRLCPPCTPQQAAQLAAAALADTLDAVSATPAAAHALIIAGELSAPPGWTRTTQRNGSLGERLAAAFADTAILGVASVLIGMDTPQVTPRLLSDAATLLGQDRTNAVLGLAEDGGWWALGLRDPANAEVLRTVPMSKPDTGALTHAALTGRGLQVTALPVLRDVDTATDARAVAPLCLPGSRFAAAVPELIPADTAA